MAVEERGSTLTPSPVRQHGVDVTPHATVAKDPRVERKEKKTTRMALTEEN